MMKVAGATEWRVAGKRLRKQGTEGKWDWDWAKAVGLCAALLGQDRVISAFGDGYGFTWHCQVGATRAFWGSCSFVPYCCVSCDFMWHSRLGLPGTVTTLCCSSEAVLSKEEYYH